MKTIQLFTLSVFSILIFSSFKPVAAQSNADGYYEIIVVTGTWKNGVSYASRIIYYPGYSNCNKYKSNEFFSEARRAFSAHLKAYYTEAFPNGENNNFMSINTKLDSYDYLETKAQAEQRLTEWIAEQKEQGYKVQLTNFSFSCDNL